LERWRAAHREAFPSAENFWRTQELLAEISWDVSSRHFPWPPQDGRDLVDLAAAIRPKTLRSTPYILRTMGAIMPDDDPMLRTFVDANLLISAQTTADEANALYGSAALDLPRRGVNHIDGGVGGIAETLVNWIRHNGGEILFKQQVDKVAVRGSKVVAVHTNLNKRNKNSRRVFACDNLLGNVTPWALRELLNGSAPPALQRETRRRQPTWGAFML
jgi:phytoene dehydrogenase-like protein